MKPLQKIALGLTITALTGSMLTTAQAGAQPPAGLQDVLFVGNNWEGTADAILPSGDFRKIGRVDVIPDIDERMKEIRRNPLRLGYFLGIRKLIGEGHDQFVDDMYTSADGRLLVVSRPSLADVVAIDLESGDLAWRFEVEGNRSDHMAVSPDGRHVAVSASTANLVHILDIETGAEVGQFPSGDSPHENVYSADGSHIYHASIGTVYTPLDHPWLDTTKGDRVFQVVDAQTNQVVRTVDLRQKLKDFGRPELSIAVRPMTLSPDENVVYFQVSFFHGFVEYNLAEDRITRIVDLPIADAVKDLPKSKYLLDSAHHGIALNPQGSKLCVAGTMSDYATIVPRDTLTPGALIKSGVKPYWATPSADGQYCFVSWSGSDKVSVISYETGREVASTTVGDHPQRMRLGKVPAGWDGA